MNLATSPRTIKLLGEKSMKTKSIILTLALAGIIGIVLLSSKEIADKDGYLEDREMAGSASDVDDQWLDESLLVKARAALLASPEVPSMTVDVKVKGGDIILSGYVASKKEKAFAAEALADLDGLGEIFNNIEVRDVGVDDAYQVIPSPSTPKL